MFYGNLAQLGKKSNSVIRSKSKCFFYELIELFFLGLCQFHVSMITVKVFVLIFDFSFWPWFIVYFPDANILFLNVNIVFIVCLFTMSTLCNVPIWLFGFSHTSLSLMLITRAGFVQFKHFSVCQLPWCYEEVRLIFHIWLWLLLYILLLSYSVEWIQ